MKASKTKLQENVPNGVEAIMKSNENGSDNTEHINKKQRILEKIVYEDLDTEADSKTNVQQLNLSKVTELDIQFNWVLQQKRLVAWYFN